jgi:hypothetical protein
MQACGGGRITAFTTADGRGESGRGPSGDAVAAGELVCERGEVGDGVGGGVFCADGGHAAVGGFAGFGEGVVAGVEIFAFLL